MSDEKNTINDIKSGKGLPPINTPNGGSSSNGLTTENRGQNSAGIRIDRFAQIKDSDKNDGK